MSNMSSVTCVSLLKVLIGTLTKGGSWQKDPALERIVRRSVLAMRLANPWMVGAAFGEVFGVISKLGAICFVRPRHEKLIPTGYLCSDPADGPGNGHLHVRCCVTGLQHGQNAISN